MFQKLWKLQREKRIDDYYSRNQVKNPNLKNKLCNKNIIINNLTEK